MTDLRLTLRDARKAAGITQEKLAKMLKVSRVTVARWETLRIRIHPAREDKIRKTIERIER